MPTVRHEQALKYAKNYYKYDNQILLLLHLFLPLQSLLTLIFPVEISTFTYKTENTFSPMLPEKQLWIKDPEHVVPASALSLASTQIPWGTPGWRGCLMRCNAPQQFKVPTPSSMPDLQG